MKKHILFQNYFFQSLFKNKGAVFGLSAPTFVKSKEYNLNPSNLFYL